jgi:hypothetical protein
LPLDASRRMLAAATPPYLEARPSLPVAARQLWAPLNTAAVAGHPRVGAAPIWAACQAARRSAGTARPVARQPRERGGPSSEPAAPRAASSAARALPSRRALLLLAFGPSQGASALARARARAQAQTCMIADMYDRKRGRRASGARWTRRRWRPAPLRSSSRRPLSCGNHGGGAPGRGPFPLRRPRVGAGGALRSQRRAAGPRRQLHASAATATRDVPMSPSTIEVSTPSTQPPCIYPLDHIREVLAVVWQHYLAPDDSERHLYRSACRVSAAAWSSRRSARGAASTRASDARRARPAGA